MVATHILPPGVEVFEQLDRARHRGVKAWTDSMLEFKDFDNAAITIADIKPQHRIRKDQFALDRLEGVRAALPPIFGMP
jgi:hypothetical protein